MRNMLKALTINTLAAAPLLFLASPAHASTNVTLTGGELSINSGDVADSITISESGSFITVNNANDTLITNFACTQVNSTTVRCPLASVNRILLNVQGGGDFVANNTSLRVRAFLGPGGDTYFGGSNEDFVSGDSDGDVMTGKGGNDILVGGTGIDTTNGGIGSDFCEAETEMDCELN
ncbi:calcium-binding protein [Nonomuraea sp. NPDC049655]|uniref:calcium-binding protein n=1 Tax=Nonomuraea sp. NPDC049655 TaxID=3364355 RepID=UPI0037B16891